jgi:23S rRNA pseudouridine2605 synthase
VRRLVRTRIGPITDRRLAPGAWRALQQSEVQALYAASSTTTGETAPVVEETPD